MFKTAKTRGIIFCFIISWLFLFTTSKAACILPIPDTGNPHASSMNLAGYLVETHHGFALIQDYQTKNKIYVNASSLNIIYSAFGGDGTLSELKPGVAVRVWYEGCKKPLKGIPRVAYFEFFSEDPHDQPPASYFYIK